MSAEKLSRWSNPGWLTPAYRQSLPSLVRSNRNHQLGKLRVMKTALNMQTWEGKRHPEHLCSTCSKPILPSLSHCSWNANHTCRSRHLCSSSTTAVAWENCSVTDATQASAVFTAWEECLHSRVAENKPGSLTEVPELLIAASSPYINVLLCSQFEELQGFSCRLPHSTKKYFCC